MEFFRLGSAHFRKTVDPFAAAGELFGIHRAHAGTRSIIGFDFLRADAVTGGGAP